MQSLHDLKTMIAGGERPSRRRGGGQEERAGAPAGDAAQRGGQGGRLERQQQLVQLEVLPSPSRLPVAALR